MLKYSTSSTRAVDFESQLDIDVNFNEIINTAILMLKLETT